MTRSIQNDSALQLQQKIIFYKSELSIYQNKIKEYEELLEKEKKRNRYLQQRLYESELKELSTHQKQIHYLKDQIQQLEIELEEERNKNQRLYENLYPAKPIQREVVEKLEMLPYFVYSFILPDLDEKDQRFSTVLGSFIIRNTGNNPLHDLSICIRIKPPNAGYLSGKISPVPKLDDDKMMNEGAAEEWVYIHDNWKDIVKERGEYWLKQKHSFSLGPGDMMSFTNFDIKLAKPTEGRAVVVEGFAYCKELKNGVSALNTIVISF